MDIPNILPVWQPVGHSTHIIAAKVAEKYGVLTSHTGTIDPMAEGVVIVLLGEERLKKYEFAKWPKVYEFEVVFGLSTDTYDGMGVVTSFHEGAVSEEALRTALKSFEGEYTQDVPPYSAARVKGKPLHWFARNKKLSGIAIPRKVGKIYEIKLVDFYEKDFKHIVNALRERISKVTGDFRQSQINTRWVQLVEAQKAKKTVQVAKIWVKTSKGLYIRSLSQDIAHKMKTTGFVYSLVRTENGEHTKKDAKTLVEVFGNNYSKTYNFTSNP